ncbi:hypothetical protein FRY77_14510 [Halomonas sp. MG34]|nr:hypothetical protein [Halomonas sp. MG34]
MHNDDRSITIAGTTYTVEDFQQLSQEEKIELMREWFFDNYEDPVERTPYESREGGYIYIWGGPYYAHDELTVFCEFVDDELIESLAEELSVDCPEWTGRESPDDYDDSYLEAYLTGNKYFESFKTSINHVKVIHESKISGEAKQHLLGLLYVNIITAIETYLSDAFISTVLENKDVLRKFVESNPEFKKQNFCLSEVFIKHDRIESDVKDYLLGLMWHNIKKIKPMYKSTLEVSFPSDLSNIFQAVIQRHNLVHRGGKNKDGEIILVTDDELNELIVEAEIFINHVDEQINRYDEQEL